MYKCVDLRNYIERKEVYGYGKKMFNLVISYVYISEFSYEN